MNKVIQGDCLIELKTLEENSVDSIVTDPPYELGFMGKSWDNTGIANNKEMWAECLRVLKPGGHLLAFSGTRTYHRMASAIEDAGFDIRDQIAWCYGQGFPKSLNIGKAVDRLQGNEREVIGVSEGKGYSSIQEKNIEQENRPYIDGLPYLKADRTLTKGTSKWEGWGTALKPAHEPICMARKPLAEKTVAENCLKWGCGGINIDASRVSNDSHEYDDNISCKDLSHKDDQNNHTQNIDHQDESVSQPLSENDQTSTPSLNGQNLSKSPDCQGDCLTCCGQCGEQSHLSEVGDQVSVPTQNDVRKSHDHLLSKQLCNRDLSNSSTKTINIERQSQARFPANLIHDGSDEVRECFPNSKAGSYKGEGSKSGGIWSESTGKPAGMEYGDSGSASRFFKSIIYQAKSSKSDRNKGLDCYLTVKYNGSIINNNKTLCKEENMVAVQLLQKVISERELVSFNIDESGVNIMVQCHKDFLSTILTETKRIIGLKIYNLLMLSLTNESTQVANSEMEVGGSLVENVADLKRWILTTTKGNQELALGASRVVCEMLQLISVEENWKEKTNTHATVKPIALMEYLIKMVTPKGGIVLDPFAGSGSTLVAAKQNGYQYIGIEMTPEYLPIIEARLKSIDN